jgi:hypothetical protein
VKHPKLTELVHADLLDYSGVGDSLRGYDAVLYCLGVSSTGRSEEAYARVTELMTIAAAEGLRAVNPELSVCFVSGVGADPSEKGRVMWARVKGRTENAVLAMPLRGAWVFRPAFVHPLKGVRSRTPMYNAFYALIGPFQGLLARVVPTYVTTTEKLGLALIRAARDGAPTPVVEGAAIGALADAEARYLSTRS